MGFGKHLLQPFPLELVDVAALPSQVWLHGCAAQLPDWGSASSGRTLPRKWFASVVQK